MEFLTGTGAADRGDRQGAVLEAFSWEPRGCRVRELGQLVQERATRLR
jgi:hypothetical protein